MKDTPSKITIVGAGLVGSLLAVMLGRRGYRVSVFERRPDMRRVEIPAGRSINLALAERGIHALKEAGLFDEVQKRLIPMRGRLLHQHDGALEFQTYGQRPHEVIYSVSRNGLNSLMLEAAEGIDQVQLFFDHRSTEIDLSNRTIRWLDESSQAWKQTEFEMLIGADGAGSVVRTAIERACGEPSVTDRLDHDYKELCIPAGPDGSFQMRKEVLHIWPRGGYMLIALPNLDGSFTVTLFLPRQGNPSFESIDGLDMLDDFFDSQFPDAKALIPDLQSDYFGNPTGELATIRCRRWVYDDCAFILGDAAHAIVPFHGQGMNAGFEDCTEFMRLLEESGDNWPRAMVEFERTRKPNADAIADMALENYLTMRHQVLDERFQIKKQLGFELERQYPSRFIPRYSMVMFHRIPYLSAMQRGRLQDGILDQLIGGAQSFHEINLQNAQSLIVDRLPEILDS